MVNPVEISPLGNGLFSLSWSSTLASATFYVYRDGVLILTTPATSAIVFVPVGDSPVYEVLDDPGATPTAAFPGYMILAWYASAGSASYRIDQLIGASWTPLITIDDLGQGTFQYRTATLPDGQTSQFRVVPIGTNGNAGTPTAFASLIVRHPDPPNVTMAFNAVGATVTISAA